MPATIRHCIYGIWYLVAHFVGIRPFSIKCPTSGPESRRWDKPLLPPAAVLALATPRGPDYHADARKHPSLD